MANLGTLKVAWLFPDTFCLYGDRGNMLAFEAIAKKAGLDVTFDRVDFETKSFNPMDYDFIYCPPGEISAQLDVMKWLEPYKEGLVEYINSGRPLLVTGTSQVMFGKKVKRLDGSEPELLGIIDCEYKEKEYIYGDDLYFTTNYDGEDMVIIGSQIQMVDIFTKEKPFGLITYGYGNTGKTREEGSIVKNAIFTNCLGPILVLTPWLTKKIILLALKNKGIGLADFELDMDLEKKAIESKIEFIKEKGKELPIY